MSSCYRLADRGNRRVLNCCRSIVSGNNLGQNSCCSALLRSELVNVILLKEVNIPRRQQLAPPKPLSGKERRLLNPNHGLVKLFERNMDRLISRFLYPHLSAIWNPYAWLIEHRFRVAETTLSPPGWPEGIPALRVLLLSDIHCGIFLKPETLAQVVKFLMQLKPDLVVVTGDIVTGHSREVRPFLDSLAPLSRAPRGAWFCFGNHDYFGGDPEEIRIGLQAIGIMTLKNESVKISHGTGSFVLGGIDDLILGKPDWARLMSELGTPHILLSHNPDQFYDAAGRGVALVVSGHTHGGQIRFTHGPPIIRQSRFCLDEGVYSFESSVLVVTRGLGSILLPWRWGADPEAVMIDIVPAK
jgi:predicted MPP superfamily phosphohydrolase